MQAKTNSEERTTKTTTADQPMSVHFHISDIHGKEINKLHKRNFYLLFCMGLLATMVIGEYAYFYHKACWNNDAYLANEDENGISSEYENQVFVPLGNMIWINFVILAVILFCVGTFMLRRLRLYFRDFFEEYGRSLWIANVLLSLPLCFRGGLDALRMSSAWDDFWFNHTNYYRLACYNMVLCTLGTYVPIMTQTSSLIFGLVRNKQVKLMDKDAGIHKDQLKDKRKKERGDNESGDDESSESDDSVSAKSKVSGNSFFDPPLENYRFYY